LRLDLQQILAVQRRGPVRHLIAVAARQHIAERALARAVRPHDGMHLAGRDLQREPLEDALVLFLQLYLEIVDLQHSPLLRRGPAAPRLSNSLKGAAQPPAMVTAVPETETISIDSPTTS